MSVTLSLKVVPGASRNHIAGWLDTRLKLRVTAAPEKGKANKAVIRLLAAALGLPDSSISLVSGSNSVIKTVRIAGLTEAEVMARLDGANR